jgi:hypothetical protein
MLLFSCPQKALESRTEAKTGLTVGRPAERTVETAGRGVLHDRAQHGNRILLPEACSASGNDLTAGSLRVSSQRVHKRDVREILFVVRHHDAVVGGCDRRDDHVEFAARAARGLSFGHQTRPMQSSSFVE